MPEVAAAATEAVLAEWLLAEGATFAVGDGLASVETEKALVDIEADVDGTLLKILAPGGQLTAVGAPIAVLAAVGEQVDDVGAVLSGLDVDQDLGSGSPATREVPRVVEAATGGAPVVGAAAKKVGDERPDIPQNGRVFASPLARKLVRDAGLAIEDIEGTGPRNRVLRRDVDAAVAARATTSLVVNQRRPGGSTPAVADFDEIPHTRLRRAIASRLQHSKREMPHFYLRASVRADRLTALRAELNEDPETDISLNDLLIKAVAAAHVRVPAMNVTWTEDAVRRPRSVDVAVAVATARGLVAPVIRDVPGLTATALAARVQDLASRARDGRLKQDELEGGTISITNLGMYGVEDFAAIINPPQAAILAVGAIREAPVVVDGALTVGKVFNVTLAVDHRPVDGVVAAQWLQSFVQLAERPSRILA